MHKQVPVLMAISLVLFLTACNTSQPEPFPTTLPDPTPTTDPQIELYFTAPREPDWSNIPYIPDGSPQHWLDIFLPENQEGPFPVILAIHGGGFRARSKNHFHPMAMPLIEMGYALVPINYRLTPSVSYPGQVEDVFCALAWIHANHEVYNFDDKHVFVMGDSAGGYLAAMLGTVETPEQYLKNCPHPQPETEWLKGAIIFYGLFDFINIEGYPEADVREGLEPFWGAEYSAISPELLAEMSPLSWVDGTEPPFLLLHGTQDPSVPYEKSEEFAAALADAGAEAELLLFEAPHAFILQPVTSPVMAASLGAIEAFIKRTTEQ